MTEKVSLSRDSLASLLRIWRDEGSTEFTADGVVVHISPSRTYMAGTLPDALAMALYVIDVGEQL